MRVIKIVDISKKAAQGVCGSMTQTTKMPCKSYSLPTESCVTGFRMAKIKGSICSKCYANKGNYARYENGIKPAQFARLDSITQALENAENETIWLSAMVSLIGKDEYFRFHDSGDLQSVEHFNLIVNLAKVMPKTTFWLPTREYGMIKDYIQAGNVIPKNLIVRLSAMYVDQPVIVPKSLQNVANVTTSNVHSTYDAKFGNECQSYKNDGQCNTCRLCWTTEPVTYGLH